MKKLFLLFSVLMSGNIQSQVNIINTSLDTNLNHLYFESDNILQVRGPAAADKITVTSTSGNVDSQGNLKFFLVPKKNKKDTLRVFKNGKEIFQKVFVIIPPPGYRVMLGSSTETTQTINEIMASPELFPFLPKGNYMEFAKENILGYKMQIVYKNKSKSAILEHKKDGKLGEAEKKLVKTLKPGDKIQFTEVLFSKDGKKVEMGKQVFTVK